jgi:hypothetical protein
MSDLALATQFFTDDLLAQLAAEQGLSTEVEEVSSNSRVYTNFTRVENVRMLKSSWQNATTMEWNYPGETDVESFGRDFPYVNEVEGFILHSELQAGLYEDNNEEGATSQTKPVCTLVGYRNSKGDYVKKLPETLTYFSKMYGDYDVAAKRPVYTSPNSALKDLGLLGSRGLSCFDCISSGKSTKDNPKQANPHECKLRGRIYFYVTHLRSFFKEGKTVIEETKSVQELMGQPGFVMLISLPTSVGLKGKYDKSEENLIRKGELKVKDAEKTRQCYLTYLTRLQNTYGKKLPVDTVIKLVATNICIRPPVPGETNSKNYLTFQEVGLFDKSLSTEASKVRQELFPVKEPEILDPSNWVINGVGGTTMYSSAKVDDSADYPMIEAAMVSDNEADAEIPF